MSYSQVPKNEEPVVKRNKCQSCLHFLYNSHDGTIIGRTPKSWGLILIFYVIYYTLLTGFFVGMLSVFLYKVIDEKKPLQTGDNSILRFKLGVNVKPRMPAMYRSSSVNTSAPFIEYSKDVNAFFKQSFLNQFEQKNGVSCGFNVSTPTDLTKFCIFEKKLLGNCSNPVSESLNGRLCIFVRPNSIYGWLPDITNKTVSNDILVKCEGQNPGDESSLGTPVFSPSITLDGKSVGVISNKHFPFTNQKNYSIPMVAVQFPKMRLNLAILVQCSFFNIKNFFQPVKFEIMMTDVDTK